MKGKYTQILCFIIIAFFCSSMNVYAKRIKIKGLDGDCFYVGGHAYQIKKKNNATGINKTLSRGLSGMPLAILDQVFGTEKDEYEISEFTIMGLKENGYLQVLDSKWKIFQIKPENLHCR